MRKSLPLSVFVISSLALLFCAEARAQRSEEVHAREAADRFMQARKAEDLDSVLKTASFPFYADRRQVFEKDAELRAMLKEQIDQRDYSDLVWKVKMVHHLDDLLAKATGEEKLLLERVARAGDFVVQILVTHDGREDEAALFARVAAGQATIIGLSD